MKIISNKSILGNVWMIDDLDKKIDNIFDYLLIKRKIEDLDNFLNPTIKHYMPNPNNLKDMDLATEIIKKSILNKEKITVFGDYDVDGITSTAIVVKYLKELKVDVDFYIPNREQEGYGLNEKAIHKIYEKGTNLIITVDCGITCLRQVELVKKLGMKIIITDHHEPDANLPNADAIINPKRHDDNSKLNYLAGVGVAFLMLVSLNSKLKNTLDNNINLFDYIDLVSMGTVCDTMPLIELNRAFVVAGLKVLNSRKNIGLSVLMDISNVINANVYSIGFILGPRLNAAGRIDSALTALDLLLTDNILIAQDLAEKLNCMNQDRVNIQNIIMLEADEQADLINKSNRNSIFVCGNNWHGGVMGIIAGRLKDRYNKPVCIATNCDGKINGSGRSIEGIDLGNIIHSALSKGLLIEGGGHALAAGFSLLENNLEDFKLFFENCVIEQLNGKKPVKSIFVDLELNIQGATKELAEQISKLEPFGQGNIEPILVLKSCCIKNSSIINKTNHIRGYVSSSYGYNIPFVSFNNANTELGNFLLDSANLNTNINMLGKLKLNEYQGNRNIQFFLDDISI